MALVDYDVEGDVGRLTLNRPAAGNSVDPAFADDFAAAVEAAIQRPARAVLVTAQGANFCLGGDVRYLAAAGSRAADVLKAMASRFHAAQLKLWRLPVPVIAGVQGNVVGGGLGLVLAADYVVCADSARFSTGYARLGLSPDAGVSYFLTQALGPKRARSLLMEPRFVGADEALGLGIVDRVVPEADLQETASHVALQFAQGPTSAYAAIKRLTEVAWQGGLEEHLGREEREIVTLAQRDDVVRAIGAVAGRSAPVFAG